MQNRIQKILVLDSYGDAYVANLSYGHVRESGATQFTAVVKIPQYPDPKVPSTWLGVPPPGEPWFNEPKKETKPWFATVVYPPDAQRTGLILYSTYEG